MSRDTRGHGGMSRRIKARSNCLAAWITGERMSSCSILLAGLALLLATLPESAPAYEQRPNTVSLGMQGGVGYLAGSGAYEWKPLREDPILFYYGDFDLGPSYAIRLRYSLSRSIAVGVSAESREHHRKSDKQADLASSYKEECYSLDYYIYLNRPERLSQYLVLGVGASKGQFRFEDADTDFAEYGLPPFYPMANLGFGLEYFVSRPLSLDMSLRGYYTMAEGGRSYSGQLQIGFQYYVIR